MIHPGDTLRRVSDGVRGEVIGTSRHGYHVQFGPDLQKDSALILMVEMDPLRFDGPIAVFDSCPHTSVEQLFRESQDRLEAAFAMLGALNSTLVQIRWMADNYLTKEFGATPDDFRKVLRDIHQVIRYTESQDAVLPELRARYQDYSGNIFPPAYRAGDGTTNQEGTPS